MLGFLFAFAGVRAEPANAIRLWQDKAPGALGDAETDVPTLTPFLPPADKATGAAFIICPGGGYLFHANHEGEHYARFLNESGIAGFVLKYRLGQNGYRHPAMLHDAARAVRLVRARATEWKLNPKKIGIMGSSAGGHLSSTLLTHFDAGKADATDEIERQSSRPDLGILCYPVITMGEFAHQGSREALLGKTPSPDLVKELSSELQVRPDTPPCFLWHTWDDTSVAVENCLMFAEALRKQAVPFDLHIYQHGRHGLGLGTLEWNPGKRHPWAADLAFWLKAQGFAK